MLENNNQIDIKILEAIKTIAEATKSKISYSVYSHSEKESVFNKKTTNKTVITIELIN